MVLLLGASLLARGIAHAGNLDLGFDVRGTTVVSVFPPSSYDSARRGSLATQVDVAIRTANLPTTAVSADPPLFGENQTTVRRPEQSEQANLVVAQNVVSPSFFDVLHIPLVAGRPLGVDGSSDDVIVNETLAAMMWPGQSALGQSLVNGKKTVQVVGVAKDALLVDLERVRPTIFWHGTGMNVLVPRSATGTIEAVKSLVASLDPNLTVKTWPLSDAIQDQVQGVLVGAWTAAGLSLLALILAAVGTFGVFSYIVSERTREIGIRMALGAGRWTVLRLVMNRAARAVGAGVVTGSVLSLAVSPLLRSYLYGLSPTDPVTYAGATAVLLVIAGLSTAMPVARAIHVNPAETLRHE